MAVFEIERVKGFSPTVFENRDFPSLTGGLYLDRNRARRFKTVNYVKNPKVFKG